MQNEPMIFGRPFNEILNAQQGMTAIRPVDLSKPSKKPATDKDRAMLAEMGIDGLRERQLFGVMDRLGIA